MTSRWCRTEEPMTASNGSLPENSSRAASTNCTCRGGRFLPRAFCSSSPDRSTATIRAPLPAKKSVNTPVPQPISKTWLCGPTPAESAIRSALRAARRFPAGEPQPQASSASSAARRIPCRHLAVRPRFFPVICKHEGIVRRRRSGVNTETPDPAFDKVGRHCISWWRFPNPWPDGDRWPACSRRRRGGNDASAEREFAFRARTECEQGRQRIASRRREHRPAQMLPAITKRKAPGREKGAMPSGSKKRARDAAARRVT